MLDLNSQFGSIRNTLTSECLQLATDEWNRRGIRFSQAVATLVFAFLLVASSLYSWGNAVSAWADDPDDNANNGETQLDIDDPAKTENGTVDDEDDAVVESDETGGLTVQLVDAQMQKAAKDKKDLGQREDELTYFMQGDATFEGMVFEIFDDDGDFVTKITADEMGEASVPEKKQLPLGTYTVKQNAKSARAHGYKENAKWATNGVKVKVNIPDAEADAGKCECEPVRGAIRLNRVDGELYDTSGIEDLAQGKASLADAVYEVYNASASTVLVNDIAFKPYDESLEPEIADEEESEGEDAEEEDAEEEEEEIIDYDDGIARNRPIMELTTDEFGIATSGEETAPYDELTGLPWGTYLIKEKKASKGYRKDKKWTTLVEVRGEERFDAQDVARATTIHGGLKLAMVDSEMKDGQPQGDATLKGAVFEVVSANGKNSSVIVDGKAYAGDEVIMKITTNKKGVAKCDKKALPYGKYKVRMCKDKGTESYAYDKKWNASISVKKNGKRATTKKKKPYAAKVVRGGISVKELEAQSDFPLEDAEIEVVNVSTAPILVNGEMYYKDQTVLTLITDEDGVAESAKDALPYGTYTLREKTPSDGYEQSKDWSPTVKIRSQHKMVAADNIYSTPSSEVVQPADNQPRVAYTILPFVAVGAAIIIILALAIIGMRHRRSVRAEQNALSNKMLGTPARSEAAKSIPSGMRSTKSNKTYIEAAHEAQQNAPSSKSFDELSRYANDKTEKKPSTGAHARK